MRKWYVEACEGSYVEVCYDVFKTFKKFSNVQLIEEKVGLNGVGVRRAAAWESRSAMVCRSDGLVSNIEIRPDAQGLKQEALF